MRLRLIKYFIIGILLVFLIVIEDGPSSSMSTKTEIRYTVSDFDGANALFDSISSSGLSIEIFQKAYSGFCLLNDSGYLDNKNVITIVDFSKSSNEKRLYVFDLKSKRLLFNELVAHGENSGDEFATGFSNEKNSGKSSLGFHITGEAYYGENGYSLKLFGIEEHYNSRVFGRGIVIHGSPRVSDEFISENGILVRSNGCLTVSDKICRSVIQTIKQGSCLFVYFADNEYLKNSKWIKK